MISIILDNNNELSINVAEETDEEEEEEKEEENQTDLSTITEAVSGENGEDSPNLGSSFDIHCNTHS